MRYSTTLRITSRLVHTIEIKVLNDVKEDLVFYNDMSYITRTLNSIINMNLVNITNRNEREIVVSAPDYVKFHMIELYNNTAPYEEMDPYVKFYVQGIIKHCHYKFVNKINKMLEEINLNIDSHLNYRLDWIVL